jgi:GAF domain-containing protein
VSPSRAAGCLVDRLDLWTGHGAGAARSPFGYRGALGPRASRTRESLRGAVARDLEALRELTRLGDDSIARLLLHISRDVERIVPEIVGVSLSMVEDQLTFTMTATTGPVAELDGMQYLAGGPCEETLRTGTSHSYRAGDVIDEERWQLFARATAAQGVGSTLSLPILRDGVVVAGVNLYAATPDAFAGHHEALAEACGAWAGGAVKNADMGFSTRFQAAETPDRLRDDSLVDRAVGIVMSRWGISPEEAEERLRDAAQRAGISDAQMARAVLELLFEPSDRDVDEGPD